LTTDPIPAPLRQWASWSAGSEKKLKQIVALYGQAIDSERCILYLREPTLRRANTTHAWWSEAQFAPEWESWYTDVWVDEGPPNAEDPLYAAAQSNPEPVYIDDIANDPSGLINLEFEKRIFKHTALIHAPVYLNGSFYGILEPSRFGPVRPWTESDRAITAWVQEQLGPIAADYVTRYGP
jgi:GAF domain-containing protein